VGLRAYDKAGVTYVLAVNGTGHMRAWNGVLGDGYTDIDGSPSLPKSIAISSNRVLLGNVTVSDPEPDMVVYSDVLDHKTFGGTSYIRLAETGGEIKAMMEMGSLMTVVYKTDSIYVLAAQGGLAPFRPHLVSTGTPGPVSALAVAAIDKSVHVYLGRNGGVYLFDGSSPRSLGDHIRTYISQNIDFDIAQRSWISYNSHKNEVWVFYPAKSSSVVNRAVVISLSSGYPMWPMRWDTSDGISREFSAGIHAYVPNETTFDQMTEPWSAYSKTFDQFRNTDSKFLLGRADGVVYEMTGGTDDGYPISAYFETGVDTIGGDITRGKIIKEVDLMIDPTLSSQEIEIHLLESERGEQRKVANSKTIDLMDTGRKIAQFRRTVQTMGLKLTVNAYEKVRYSGASVSYRERGLR